MIIYCLYPSPSNPTTFNQINTHNVVHIVDLPSHIFLKLLLNIRTKGGVRLRNDRAAADRRLITVLGNNIPDLVQLPTVTSILEHTVGGLIIIIEGFQLLLEILLRLLELLDRSTKFDQYPTQVLLIIIYPIKYATFITAARHVLRSGYPNLLSNKRYNCILRRFMVVAFPCF